MDQVRAFYAELKELERRQLFSVDWLKWWITSIVIVFVMMNYIWSSIFSNMRDDHIPFALLPVQDQLKETKMYHRSASEIRNSQINQINFVIFACSARVSDEKNNTAEENFVVHEAIRTMKSAALFTKKIIHFHIFTEDALYQSFIAEIDRWPNQILHRITFQFHAAVYPESILPNYAKDRATQKACDLSFLFIPAIVKNLDFAIYAKSGTIFLSSIDELWMNFREYDERNSLALPLKIHSGICQREDHCFSKHVYHVFDLTIIEYDIQRLQTSLFKVPFARKNEYRNQSLFPLNVDQFEIKEMTWGPSMLLALHTFFKNSLTSPGIDLLNIIALFNPDNIYSLPCEWNFDVQACYQSEHRCPNAKLITSNENTDRQSFSVEFEQISKFFDEIDLSKFNRTDIINNLQRIKSQIYLDWPLHSFCSLTNMNSFLSVL